MTTLKVPVNHSDHVQGNNNAPVELVEYGDYQCPYCGEAYHSIKLLQEKLGDDLKFVFRNFPLTESHNNAQNAARAAEAAAVQGKFWEMHDILFENQKSLNDDDLVNYAEQLDLDVEKFMNDMHSNKVIEKVEKDFESGIWSGVNQTPSFYINGEKQRELNQQKVMEYARAVHS